MSKYMTISCWCCQPYHMAWSMQPVAQKTSSYPFCRREHPWLRKTQLFSSRAELKPLSQDPWGIFHCVDFEVGLNSDLENSFPVPSTLIGLLKFLLLIWRLEGSLELQKSILSNLNPQPAGIYLKDTVSLEIPYLKCLPCRGKRERTLPVSSSVQNACEFVGELGGG